jgi:hypothetical protein
VGRAAAPAANRGGSSRLPDREGRRTAGGGVRGQDGCRPAVGHKARGTRVRPQALIRQGPCLTAARSGRRDRAARAGAPPPASSTSSRSISSRCALARAPCSTTSSRADRARAHPDPRGEAGATTSLPRSALNTAFPAFSFQANGGVSGARPSLTPWTTSASQVCVGMDDCTHRRERVWAVPRRGHLRLVPSARGRDAGAMLACPGRCGSLKKFRIDRRKAAWRFKRQSPPVAGARAPWVRLNL